MSRFVLRRTDVADLTTAQAAERLRSSLGAAIISQDERNLLVDCDVSTDGGSTDVQQPLRDLVPGFVVAPQVRYSAPLPRIRSLRRLK